jgi:hypothetical protein
MPWPEVQQVAEKYPWAIIDPSVLIGHRTPRTFEELADDQVPLWRQFYFDWMEENNGSTLPRDQAETDLQMLTISARSRKEPTKVAQQFADVRRETAKKELKANGPIDGFYDAIREIKDAIEKFAKESKQSLSDVGLRFAGEAIASGSDEGAEEDKVLGEGILRMLNGPTKAEYVRAVQECLVHFREFARLTEGDWHGLGSVEDALAKAHGNWQSWEGALRNAFDHYERALDYMRADQDGRQEIRNSDPDHAGLYSRIESGQLRKDLWEVISRYGQSMLAEWTTIADCFAAMVKWATADARNKMRENFNAAFKEASAGILAAKTAVGVTTTVLAFFPPFGSVVGAGLNLCMTIAEIASKEILIWQASNDPNTVLAYLGREFGKDVPESQRDELLKNIAEYGLTALELMEQGTDVIANATKAGIALSPYISEAAKAAAEASFTTMETVMPVVGGVLTVVSLTHAWYQWDDDQKLLLKEKANLTQDDVKALERLLEGAFDAEISNAEWHAGLGDARLLSWTEKEFRVKINGVEGTIARDTHRFSPLNRADAWNTMLAAAKGNASITYRGMPVALDLSKPADMSDVGTDLLCTVTGKCGDSPVFDETFGFVVKISAEGVITVAGVQAPAFAETVAAAAREHEQIAPPIGFSDPSHRGMETPLSFFIDWDNAALKSTSPWYYDCVAPGAVNLGKGKYKWDQIWDVTIQLPFKGMPHAVGSSADVVKPVVQVAVVRAALKDKHAAIYPPPSRSVAPSYTADWDSAEFADFDRERGGFQIRSLSAYDFNANVWNTLQDLWVGWDFSDELALLDLENMTETIGVSPEKTDELEKIFTNAVATKKPTRLTGRHYRRIVASQQF